MWTSKRGEIGEICSGPKLLSYILSSPSQHLNLVPLQQYISNKPSSSIGTKGVTKLQIKAGNVKCRCVTNVPCESFLESHKWLHVSRVRKTPNGDFWRERCLFGKCREYVLNDPSHFLV